MQSLSEEAGGMQFNTGSFLFSKHFPLCWEWFRVPSSLTVPDPSWHYGFWSEHFFFLPPAHRQLELYAFYFTVLSFSAFIYQCSHYFVQVSENHNVARKKETFKYIIIIKGNDLQYSQDDISTFKMTCSSLLLYWGLEWLRLKLLFLFLCYLNIRILFPLR